MIATADEEKLTRADKAMLWGASVLLATTFIGLFRAIGWLHFGPWWAAGLTMVGFASAIVMGVGTVRSRRQRMMRWRNHD